MGENNNTELHKEWSTWIGLIAIGVVLFTACTGKPSRPSYYDAPDKVKQDFQDWKKTHKE